MENIDQKKIKLSKSCISDSEKKAAMNVLDNEYLGMGNEVQVFETNLTEFFNRSVVCVSNGTAALHLALQAADIGPGDEVLVQSITYVASFQAISASGANPVACDIDPNTLCLDLKDAKKRLTPNTKAVMPVHYAGGVGQLDEIYAFAKENKLRVIEDAAHAFGSEYNNKRIGSFGDISCFSFDGIKNITSGEGGCIVTNDKDVIEKAKDARLLGVKKDSDKRYLNKRTWEMDVSTQGWRYHMSNIMAAIGIEQLKRFKELSIKRQELAKLYDDLFSKIPEIRLLPNNYSEIVPHIYPIILGGTNQRTELQQKLKELGIETGIHYYPNQPDFFCMY